jgi:hypothetical protein
MNEGECMLKIVHVRGVFRIKCAGRNNFTTNHFRSSAISGPFKAYFMPIRTYRSQRSTYRRKAAAESFLLLIRATPSQLFMRTAWDSKRSAGFDFASLKQKKIRRSRIQQIVRLTDRLDEFATIKSLTMVRRQSLFLRPSTKTGPGTMI